MTFNSGNRVNCYLGRHNSPPFLKLAEYAALQHLEIYENTPLIQSNLVYPAGNAMIIYFKRFQELHHILNVNYIIMAGYILFKISQLF